MENLSHQKVYDWFGLFPNNEQDIHQKISGLNVIQLWKDSMELEKQTVATVKESILILNKVS
jgi:hypothetical protein